MPKTYTVKDVANILGFSTNSIYTFLKEKRIKGVRVGKGRFRIPEEELSRILHLSKNPFVTPLTPVEPVVSQALVPQTALVHDREDESILTAYTKSSTILDADVFDWFLGIASIVSGVSLYLFNWSAHAEPLIDVIPIIRIILICSGLGIIISALQGKSKNWHTFFHGLLGVTSIMGVYGLGRSGDMGGAVLYGTLGIVIFANMIQRVNPEVSIGRFTTILAFGSVLSMALWPGQAHMTSLAAMSHMSVSSVQWIILALAIINTSLYWIGYTRKISWAFTVSCVLSAIIFMLTATLYGQFLYWSRAFFYIVLAFFCLFLPVSLLLAPNTSNRQRLYLHIFFGGVGGLLLLAVFVVFSLHQVLWRQRVNDFENKITVGRTILENAISDVKGSVITASGNSDFLQDVVKNDADGLVRNAKIVYEGNPMIRRLVFLNQAGDGVAIYPYGVFDRTNYAFREYYTHTRDTKAIYVSSVFDSNIDAVVRPVVSVSMPLLDEKNSFRGVMSASVNLDKIALQLQQMALESGGEFFTVVDQEGRYVIHPDITRIGLQAPLNDPIRKGIAKKRGVEGVVLPDGQLGLVAFDTISTFGWGISIQVPTGSILELSVFSLVLTFGMLFGVFVMAVLLLYMMRFHWIPKQRGFS